MSSQAGHIELERTVASIVVGHRHRADLGDLDALAASIDREGLLQPVTITPEGVLVCGRRRLAAIKQLGWKTVNVWVRSGISDRLGQPIAEQDDNVLHKPLTPLEAAALYRELKQVMAEDAARRKAATQFSRDRQPGDDQAGGDGPANFAGPSSGLGETRQQAAAMIPGGASHTTLEKIGYLEDLAADPAQPESLRELAAAGLERIEAGQPVNPIYQSVRETAKRAEADRAAQLDALASEALARIKDTATKKTKAKRRKRASGDNDDEPVRYPVRAFVLTWSELDGWWTHYDADELAAALTPEQIEVFLRTVEGTGAFAEQLRNATTREGDTAGAGSGDAAPAGRLRAV